MILDDSLVHSHVLFKLVVEWFKKLGMLLFFNLSLLFKRFLFFVQVSVHREINSHCNSQVLHRRVGPQRLRAVLHFCSRLDSVDLIDWLGRFDSLNPALFIWLSNNGDITLLNQLSLLRVAEEITSQNGVFVEYKSTHC